MCTRLKQQTRKQSCCWRYLLLYSAILCSGADSLCSCPMWFYEWPGPFTAFLFTIHPSGVLTTLFSCCMAGAMWRCCCLSACSADTMQPTMHHFKASLHAKPHARVHVCLAATCHLHLWQNDWGLLGATAVKWGWNGYWNMSQHRKLTMEKKLLPPGLEPMMFWPWVWHFNHQAIPTPQVESTWSAQSTCNRNKKDTHSHVAHKHTHTCMHMHTRAPTPTHTHIHTHTHIYTHTHTHTHTHTPSQPSTPGICVTTHFMHILHSSECHIHIFQIMTPNECAQKSKAYSWQATDMNKSRKYYIHRSHTLVFELPSLLALYFNS